jgi:hypothetical protein
LRALGLYDGECTVNSEPVDVQSAPIDIRGVCGPAAAEIRPDNQIFVGNRIPGYDRPRLIAIAGHYDQAVPNKLTI